MTSPQLFDAHGRVNPPAGQPYQSSRRYYQIVEPKVDYIAIHERMQKYLGVEMDEVDFVTRAQAILTRVLDDPAMSGVMGGITVPFALPKAAYRDLGEALDAVYLDAAGQSFKTTGKDFRNHCYGKLDGKVSVAPGSRHERLIDEMKHGEVVGWYFPCMLERSLTSVQEQIASLPEGFMLSGGFDTAAAFVGTPGLLVRKDGYPPLLWCAGIAGEGAGYHFEAYGYNLTFNRRAHLGRASEYWGAGLTVIG